MPQIGNHLATNIAIDIGESHHCLHIARFPGNLQWFVRVGVPPYFQMQHYRLEWFVVDDLVDLPSDHSTDS